MIEKPYSVIVMSPLSLAGFGRQLAASNARISAVVAINGTLGKVVLLMKILITGVAPSIPHS